MMENSIKFSYGANSEWFTESEILYDFAQQYPTVSFAGGRKYIS